MVKSNEVRVSIQNFNKYKETSENERLFSMFNEGKFCFGVVETCGSFTETVK